MCIQTVNKHVIVLGKLSNISNNRRILIKDMLGVIWAYGRRVRNNFISVVIFIEIDGQKKNFTHYKAYLHIKIPGSRAT